MSRQLVLTISLLTLVLSPVALVAQRGGGGGGAGEGTALQALQRNPIQVVLDARAELGLTTEQVALLKPVRDRLLEQNRENLARIDSIVQATPRTPTGNRDAMQAMMEQIRPLRQEVQENNRAAIQEIRPHLTAAQSEQVTALLQPQRRRPGTGG